MLNTVQSPKIKTNYNERDTPKVNVQLSAEVML
jgi:hypothetical protein